MRLHVKHADLLKQELSLEDLLPSGQSDFTDQIDTAYETFISDLNKKGIDPDTVPDTTRDADLVIKYKTLEIIFQNSFREIGDIYHTKMEKYQRLYETDFRELKLPVDINDSGSIDEDEEDFSPTIRFER